MPPTKVFIDSSLRKAGSDANFTYELPSFPIDKEYKVQVDQIHIPHTFTTIHANNRALYFEEKVGTGHAATTRQHRVELVPAQYDGPSLAEHVRSRLTFATTLALGTWTVTFDDSQGKLAFSVSGGTAKLYPMDFLTRNPHAFTEFSGHPIGQHDDAGPIIGVTGLDVLAIGTVPVLGKHISVSPYHCLYLHCDAGLDVDWSIGTRGNGTVLRSVPVTTSYGQMLHDTSLNANDYTLVHKGQMGALKFRLADRFGKDVSLDQSFSFSIIFSPVDEFE